MHQFYNNIMKKNTIKTHRIFFYILTLLSLSILSCKKEPSSIKAPTGELNLEFSHVWGLDMIPFNMNQTYVHPVSKDTLNINLLKYYISNIKLFDNKGNIYQVPDSYYLIDPTNNNIKISGIPEGDYNKIEYMIGVDSTKNFSGLQSGALNPSNGMFWSWSTGYIFIRVEGSSPQSETGVFMYHLGGYESPYIASHRKSHELGNEILPINPITQPTVHFNVNVARFWHGPVKVSELNVIHNIGNNAVSMSKNFADGFILDHIHQ
jgi:hypothetical protein